MTRPNPSTPEYESIGPYNVLGVLGQGGMGTVYKASHAKTNETVAVKVIAAAMAQHQRFRRRFDAEIKTLVKLKHPGIVQLIGFGEEKGLLFYSMEYVEGVNLQQLLKKEGRLPWQRVVDIAIEVCAALKHAHDFGVIHRDLKPANLMIHSDGHVKLTDFGIAKLFGAADATVEGSVLGTADFMAPEQAEGKPVTVRSDLYALGSVCYAALAGRAPFQGKSIPEVLFNVRYGNFPRLQTLVPDVPVELAILVEELLEREASRRPPTGLVVGNRFQSLKLGLLNRPSIHISNPTADASKLKELTSIDLEASPSLVRDLEETGNAQTRAIDSKEDGAIWATLPSESDGTPRTSVVRGGGSGAQREASSAVPPHHPFTANPHEKTVAQSHLPSQSPLKTGAEVPADATSVSVSQASLAESPSGIDQIGKTSFTEVDDDVRTRSATTFAVDEEPSHASHWMAVGMLSLLLTFCVGFVVYMLQKPSANSLHAPIAAALINNDEEEWLAVESIANRFLQLYPDDPRTEDAQTAIQEAELVRSVRQVQRRARRSNSDQLEAIEQAFLEVLSAQQVGAEESISKLNAFLTMFGSDTSSEKSKNFVLQATRMRDDLETSRKVAKNEAFLSLQKQMDWAEANLSPSVREKWYQAMIELFEKKPWASELVSRAKSQISKSEPRTDSLSDQATSLGKGE